MFKTNFYTGEMTGTTNGEQYTTEAEATFNAGFGQYAAQQYIPQQPYGLGGNIYQQQYGPPQQMYYQNPYMTQPQYGYGNNYTNPAFNPAFSYQNYQQSFQQQHPQQFSQVYIPPVNISGNEYLLPGNFDEIVSDMAVRICQEEAEYKGKQIAEQARLKKQGNYNPYNYNAYNGFNYYGTPVFGSTYNNFHSKVIDELNQIKEEAKQKRLDLSINLSKLAHRTIGDNMSDEDIEAAYKGRYINVQNTVYENNDMDRMQARFSSSNFVQIDPLQSPFKRYCDTMKSEIQSILPEDTTIENFGERAAQLAFKWEVEEMYDSRRRFDQSYDSSAYKRLLKEKCAEKAANEHGFSLIRSEEPTPITQIKNQISDIEAKRAKDMSPDEKERIMKEGLNLLGLPLMSEAVYFDEDGTMCLRANVGNHKGEMYTVNNENEAAYANKRALFAGFLDSIPRSEELHDQKLEQYNGYSESEFKYNMTHPKPGGGG
jgi:hypothetical protein